MVFLMSCFIVFGYASLADDMVITGSADYKAKPIGLYIIDLSVYDTSGGITDAGSEYISPTNVASAVSITGAGSITYKITVENNTNMTCWYRECIVYDTLDGYQNELIGIQNYITIIPRDKFSDTGETFNNEDWIPPHTVREFYAVYNFGSSAVSSAKDGKILTLVNFSFGEKIESYGDEVLSILNNPVKYEMLKAAFDDVYNQTGATVLANIGADEGLFQSLFGSELKLDGKDVTIAIERKNVDGNVNSGDSYENISPGDAEKLTGCEYTIYVTTGDGTVHAVSYMIENGNWRQIGALYEGTVNNGTYTDSDGVEHTGIMDISTWIAVQKTYTVFSYGGRTVQYVVANKYGKASEQWDEIEELMSEVDVDLYNTLNDHPIMKDTYNILKDHEGSEITEIVLLREAFDVAMVYYNNRNNGQQFEMKQGYKRAEILAAMEALAEAMEYYIQVHETTHQ